METTVLRVVDVMSSKVETVESTDTVFNAVSKMIKLDIGSIVVTEGGEVVGIFTKGDVLRKTVLKGLDAKVVSVKEIMSSPVVTTTTDASVEEASHLMSRRNVSKLPVLKNGRLVGIVTATDIMRAEPGQVSYLEELIRARYVPREMRSTL